MTDVHSTPRWPLNRRITQALARQTFRRHHHPTRQPRRPLHRRINLALARRAYMWRHHRGLVLGSTVAQEQVFWADMRDVLAGEAAPQLTGDPFIARFTGRQLHLW